MALKTLDLFSGIGGISRALEGIAEPVMFCELNAEKAEVLKRRYPEIPVHGDITTLRGDTLNMHLDLVQGGFPCTGFSVAGKRLGFENPASALFSEFVRVVKTVRPAFVFLENVTAVTAEIPRMCREFDEYDLRWLCMPACAVGAPQVRRRWYCLGVRRDITDVNIDGGQYRGPYRWENEPVRMTPRVSKRLRARLGMLGDAVVPAAVRAAFVALFTGSVSIQSTQKRAAQSISLAKPVAVGRPYKGTSPPNCGVSVDGIVYNYKFRVPTTEPVNVVLDPGLFEAETHRPERLEGPVTHAFWATPRGQNLGASRVLTQRTQRDLYTQLRFERGTLENRGGYPNIEWVCWLMGFDRDYFGELEYETRSNQTEP